MALEGIELRKVNRRGVTILTTEGRVPYERWALRPVDRDGADRLMESHGKRTVYPLDEFLGLDGAPFKMTRDAALLVARVGATSDSYKEAARELSELRGVPVGATTVRRVTDHVGSAVLERDRGLAASLAETWDPGSMRFGRVRGRIPRAALTLYLQMDGAMLDTKGGGWRESKLAVAFRSDELVEVAADDGTVGYRLGRRSYAASVDGIDDFRALLLPLASGAGIADAHNVVILGDGAAWIRKTRDMLFPSAVLILDLFHLKENVGEFARFLFADDEDRASEWATGCNDMLEAGRWREFLRLDEVARYRDEDTPKGVVNIWRYVWGNRDSIDYPRYVARGYFVGSGAIESANRTVMQKRIKQPGMRWREAGAGGVLALRCKLLSGSWQADVVELIRDTYTESA